MKMKNKRLKRRKWKSSERFKSKTFQPIEDIHIKISDLVLMQVKIVDLKVGLLNFFFQNFINDKKSLLTAMTLK